MSIRDSIIDRLFGNIINKRVDLAVQALDDSRDIAILGQRSERDRREYDRSEIEEDALTAWRDNPIARRIVSLTTQYVVGGGLGIESDHEKTHAFLQEWWNHRQNRMAIRSFDWCDELTRSGNLFLTISTDAAGMSYMRAWPSAWMAYIQTAENDLEQEQVIYMKPTGEDSDQVGPEGQMLGRSWNVYDELSDQRSEQSDKYETVMLHYSVNRPVGALWGESDLAPLLKWLSRYSAWLEDRVRLNRFRNIFLFWVKAKFQNEAERRRRQAELNANPPSPGSILVSDESEEWSTLYPNLSSFEAAEDGLAVKKMIAVGSANPLHFLAEPEEATRTTAEASGGPTFRHYEQRQKYFLWIIEDIMRVVLKRRATVDRSVRTESEISVKGTDISARDNAALATAANTIITSFVELRKLQLIDDQELLRMAYRFAGEIIDVEKMLERGKAAPKIDLPSNGSRPSGAGGPDRPSGGIKVKPVNIDPITGQPTNIDKVPG